MHCQCTTMATHAHCSHCYHCLHLCACLALQHDTCIWLLSTYVHYDYIPNGQCCCRVSLPSGLVLQAAECTADSFPGVLGKQHHLVSNPTSIHCPSCIATICKCLGSMLQSHGKVLAQGLHVVRNWPLTALKPQFSADTIPSTFHLQASTCIALLAHCSTAHTLMAAF